MSYRSTANLSLTGGLAQAYRRLLTQSSMIKSILTKPLQWALLGCVWLLACGESTPESRLILGSDSQRPALGQRDLTRSQARSLRAVITSGGHQCSEMSDAFLRDVAPGGESWEVRCAEGAYAVKVADVGMATVRRCREGLPGDAPCAGRRFEPYGGRRPASGQLNPDLGKLLEPMTPKEPKTD